MASRDFTVHAGGALIGKVSLEDWDRGMGVAGGIFYPNDKYSPSLHAEEIDGVALDESARRPSLSIVDADGIEPTYEQVHVADWSATIGDDGRELTVFGIDIVGVFGPEVSET